MRSGAEPEPTYVFAYGSLALLQGTATEHHLPGFVRTWDVAMDNRRDLPGYKFYVDPATGERPDLCVAFLNLSTAEDSTVNGVLLEVTLAELATVDRRERNYDRVRMTDRVSPDPGGEVYAYVGTPQARERFAQGMARGACAIDADYLDAVKDGFRALGLPALQRFEASTRPPPCPVRPLVRHDLPGLGAPGP